MKLRETAAPACQLRVATVARALNHCWLPSSDPEKARLAQAPAAPERNRKTEPSLLEGLVAATCCVVGDERGWVAHDVGYRVYDLAHPSRPLPKFPPQEERHHGS